MYGCISFVLISFQIRFVRFFNPNWKERKSRLRKTALKMKWIPVEGNRCIDVAERDLSVENWQCMLTRAIDCICQKWPAQVDLFHLRGSPYTYESFQSNPKATVTLTLIKSEWKTSLWIKKHFQVLADTFIFTFKVNVKLCLRVAS